MTADQQTALRARVHSNPACVDALNERDLDRLVAVINAAPEMMLTECWIDALGIINRCPSGKSILRKLKSGAPLDAIIEVAWSALVSSKGLDFGAASTLASISEMAPLIGFTPEEVSEMQALALQPIFVTRWDIADAVFNPDGSEK